MTTSIRIDQAALSKSGKSYKITSGGQIYYAKPEQGLQNMVGQTLDAEVAKSDYNGTEMWWINAFTKVRQDAVQTPAQSATEGQKIYSASPIAPMWLPFASNSVAHAIQAGLIKTPSELNMWVLGARHAVEAAVASKEYEPDISF